MSKTYLTVWKKPKNEPLNVVILNVLWESLSGLIDWKPSLTYFWVFVSNSTMDFLITTTTVSLIQVEEERKEELEKEDKEKLLELFRKLAAVDKVNFMIKILAYPYSLKRKYLSWRIVKYSSLTLLLKSWSVPSSRHFLFLSVAQI